MSEIGECQVWVLSWAKGYFIRQMQTLLHRCCVTKLLLSFWNQWCSFLWKEAFGYMMLSRQSFAIPATLQRSYTTLPHVVPITKWDPLPPGCLAAEMLKSHLHIQLSPRYGKIRAITPDKILTDTRAGVHKLPSFTRKLSAVGTCWERGESVFFNGVTPVPQPHSRAGPMSRSTVQHSPGFWCVHFPFGFLFCFCLIGMFLFSFWFSVCLFFVFERKNKKLGA